MEKKVHIIIDPKDLRNDFRSLIEIFKPIIAEVEVSEAIGEDESKVVATYSVADWQKGITRVGSGFYGYSELIELALYDNNGGFRYMQLRHIVSNGYGAMYRDQSVGNIIVEVMKSYIWSEFDMSKESDRVALANMFNN